MLLWCYSLSTPNCVQTANDLLFGSVRRCHAIFFFNSGETSMHIMSAFGNPAEFLCWETYDKHELRSPIWMTSALDIVQHAFIHMLISRNRIILALLKIFCYKRTFIFNFPDSMAISESPPLWASPFFEKKFDKLPINFNVCHII